MDLTDLFRVGAIASDLRVHSKVYTSPEIFEQELERIFYRTWVYVGHESEVIAPGEFRLRTIGRQSVIMVRGHDGEVHVLINRCRHRGAAVCEIESGKTKVFRCWYHGWSYDTTGKLLALTGTSGYDEGKSSEVSGLARPARLDRYRGFVFASLSPDVPELGEHLGSARQLIDYLVDASPIGEIALDQGSNKTLYRGNWKLVGMDGYHVHYVHASVISGWREDATSGTAATHRGDPFDDTSASATLDLGRGHCALDMSKHRLKYVDEYLAILKSIAGGEDYIQAMISKHGPERARELISHAGDPHLGMFPNIQLIANQVRIINPISPDLTEVIMFPVRLKGVSPELDIMRLRHHESFYGPAGAGSPDDAEIFERVQRGMYAVANPWIDLSRGCHREEHRPDGSIVGRISDEVTQRGQLREWRRLMVEA